MPRMQPDQQVGTRPLLDCGRILTGGTPDRSNPDYWGGNIPWISAKSLKTFDLIDSEDRVTEAGAAQITTVPARSILFVVRGMSLANEFRVGVAARPVTFNQDLRAIITASDIDARYLGRFLQASQSTILGLVDDASHGTKRLTADRLASLRVPIPPLAEQRRIAEVLDRMEALRAKRRTALAQLVTLTQAIFLDMFGDPVANVKGWSEVRLGAHASKIGSGATPLGGEAAYKSSGIALIRSMNVRDGRFTSEGLAFIDNDQAARLDNVVVAPDDVLLNITGASVARVCRAPREVLPARVNQHVAIIRPTHGFDSRFLEQCLLFPSMKLRLLRIAGAGATREAITKDAIERLALIQPPREMQDRFAHLVLARERTEVAQGSHLTTSNELFALLQHRAFRGEL